MFFICSHVKKAPLAEEGTDTHGSVFADLARPWGECLSPVSAPAPSPMKKGPSLRTAPSTSSGAY